jgi:hypothetical protein
MDTTRFFELAQADDGEGLMVALVGTPEGYRLRNAAGESLFQFCAYRGRAKCVSELAEAALAHTLKLFKRIAAFAHGLVQVSRT